jgi:predicted SprT family Zn-dependent metalloprotease
MKDSLNSLEGVEADDLLRNEDGSLHQFLVKLGDKKESFRCECGCNVFHKRENEPERYICNSCDAEYIGE